MVMKKIVCILSLLLSFVGMQAQENRVNRLPEIDSDRPQKVYTERNSGFWISPELSGAYSCRFNHSNFGFVELDVTAGYRFNEFVRLGAGIGARYYLDNNAVRKSNIAWTMPVFANIRGNMMATNYRNVVPYYSVDLGGTVRDGFLFRPTVGLRVGQQRSAFLVGLGYVGQDLKSYYVNKMGIIFDKRKFVSFVTLKLGYEF